MARGRMLSQKIAEDIDFNGMSIDAQFLFMRTIPFLDRDGLVVGHPGLLWSKIAPLLTQYTAITASVIQEWIDSGFAIKYMDGKTPVLFFKGFTKNQSLTHYDRESPSTFAPPPGYQRTPKGLKQINGDDGGNPPKPQPVPQSDDDKVRESSVNAPDELRTNSGLTPDQIPVNRIEENRKEGEYTPATPATQPETPKVSPPSGNSPTGDPYMDKAAARFQRRQENNGRNVANRGGQWSELDAKVPAAERLPLVERLIDMHGLRAAIDLAQDDGKLADMHKLAADLYVMGFRTLADIEKVYQQFQKEWRGKTPGGRQLITIASTMKQAQSAPAQAAKPVKPFKRWLLDVYNCDTLNIVLAREKTVSEAVIKAQYEQYKQQLQQTH